MLSVITTSSGFFSRSLFLGVACNVGFKCPSTDESLSLAEAISSTFINSLSFLYTFELILIGFIKLCIFARDNEDEVDLNWGFELMSRVSSLRPNGYVPQNYTYTKAPFWLNYKG